MGRGTTGCLGAHVGRLGDLERDWDPTPTALPTAQERLDLWQYPWGSRSLTLEGSSIWQRKEKSKPALLANAGILRVETQHAFLTGKVINCWSHS